MQDCVNKIKLPPELIYSGGRSGELTPESLNLQTLHHNVLKPQ